MSADDSADPGRQRTVAELLALHGGGSAGGSRRRRRAAEDDDEPAAPAGKSSATGASKTGTSKTGASNTGATRTGATRTGATRTGATRTGATRTGATETGATRTGATETGASGAEATGSDRGPRSRDGAAPRTPATPQVPEQRWAGTTGYGQSIDPLTGAPIDTPGQAFGSPPRDAGPGPGGAPNATGSYRSMPLARVDPPTEEMPLYPETGWASRVKDGGPRTGPITGSGSGSAGGAGAGAVPASGPATGHVSRAELFGGSDDEDHDDEDRDGDLRDGDLRDGDLRDGEDREGASERWGRRASAAPAGLAERGEHGELADGEYGEDDEADERPAGVAGWLGLIVQWVVGAVAGALLWVGFSYLWMHLPVVALVAAVAATAVLVLVVRAIRRSDDLQTTMLAVLVGLVVTISPAVLLLAVR